MAHIPLTYNDSVTISDSANISVTGVDIQDTITISDVFNITVIPVVHLTFYENINVSDAIEIINTTIKPFTEEGGAASGSWSEE